MFIDATIMMTHFKLLYLQFVKDWYRGNGIIGTLSAHMSYKEDS